MIEMVVDRIASFEPEGCDPKNKVKMPSQTPKSIQKDVRKKR